MCADECLQRSLRSFGPRGRRSRVLQEGNRVADLRESSLLFSLDSLLAHERDKIERERHAAELQKRAALEAALAAERARKAETERRAAEERERILAEERRTREESARLVAIREAEIERVRLEARL